MSASAVDDPAYTQLPEGMPARIRDLALEVTRGHTSTYAKAKALERHLSTQYTYSYADAPGGGTGTPPPGRDPVDWFLFDYQEGTCGVFSSAFVVMARSIGIPARVVAGWAIRATDKGPGGEVESGAPVGRGCLGRRGLGSVRSHCSPGAPVQGAAGRTHLSGRRPFVPAKQEGTQLQLPSISPYGRRGWSVRPTSWSEASCAPLPAPRSPAW